VDGGTHIFPSKGGTTFATINVSDGVVPSCHGTIVGLSLDNIDTGSQKLEIINVVNHDVDAYTPSKRYALPCCPLNACYEMISQ